MKVIMLCVAASIMFVAAGAAYGLGGGGHHGDGRQGYSQGAGNDCAINREEPVLSLPEPVTVLLLGLGILGLAGLTRNFRSYR